MPNALDARDKLIRRKVIQQLGRTPKIPAHLIPRESLSTNNTMPSTIPAEPVAQFDTIPIISRARVSFCMETVEGIFYDVYIVGENEELLKNMMTSFMKGGMGAIKYFILSNQEKHGIIFIERLEAG